MPCNLRNPDLAAVRAQEVYDMVKGQAGEDELYVEGADQAFLTWRAQHGEEWARYYGLRVRCRCC
jgi:hypothetical protein